MLFPVAITRRTCGVLSSTGAAARVVTTSSEIVECERAMARNTPVARITSPMPCVRRYNTAQGCASQSETHTTHTHTESAPIDRIQARGRARAAAPGAGGGPGAGEGPAARGGAAG